MNLKKAKRGIVCKDKRATLKIPFRRLTPEQVARCREATKTPLRILAKEFGVSSATIFFVRNYYSYKDLP